MAAIPQKLQELINLTKPFMDTADQAFFYMPLDLDDELKTTKHRVVSLDSTPALQYIRVVLTTHSPRGHVTDPEVKGAAEFLKGFAATQERQQTDLDVAQLIKTRTLVNALVKLRDQGGTRDTPKGIHRRLEHIVRRYELKKDPTWPDTEDALGRQLAELKPIAHKLGMILDNLRGTQRQWIVMPVEFVPVASVGIDSQASEQVSDATVAQKEDTVHPDAPATESIVPVNRLDQQPSLNGEK
jgi:hypothetical protein